MSRLIPSLDCLSQSMACQLLWWMLLLMVGSTAVTYFPSDANVQWTGRYQVQGDNTVRFDHPGTQVRLRTFGATTVEFQLSQKFPAGGQVPHYFEVYVNAERPIDINYHSFSTEGQADSTPFTYSLTGLSATEPLDIVLYKSSEPQWNAVLSTLDDIVAACHVSCLLQ